MFGVVVVVPFVAGLIYELPIFSTLDILSKFLSSRCCTNILFERDYGRIFIIFKLCGSKCSTAHAVRNHNTSARPSVIMTGWPFIQKS
jgi:hypothetical protein